MADHGSGTLSAESTTNNTPAASSSFVRSCASSTVSESTLWETALRAVGGEEVLSKFWLPELNAFNVAGGRQTFQYQGIEQWEFVANFATELIDNKFQPVFGNIPEFFKAGVPIDAATSNGGLPNFGDLATEAFMRRLQAETLSMGADNNNNNVFTDVAMLVDAASPVVFESSPRQAAAALQGADHRGDIHMADHATEKAAPYCHQSPIAENVVLPMPAANIAASYDLPVLEQTHRHEAIQWSNGQLLVPAPFSAASGAASPPEHRPACPRRRRCTAERRTTGTYALKPCPENDTVWATKHSVVPHSNCVAMPTIGGVGAFVRTPQLFVEIPKPPPQQAPLTISPTVDVPPLQPPVVPVAAPLASSDPAAPNPQAPHRYPKLTKPRGARSTQTRSNRSKTQSTQAPGAPAPQVQNWQRTNTAIDQATAIWNRAEQARSGRLWDPQVYRGASNVRPSTRGLTFVPEVTGMGPVTAVPAQPAVATGQAVGPAMNTKGKQQRVRRAPAMDPQSVYARQSVQVQLANRMRAQEMYLKMVANNLRPGSGKYSDSKL